MSSNFYLNIDFIGKNGLGWINIFLFSLLICLLIGINIEAPFSCIGGQSQRKALLLTLIIIFTSAVHFASLA